MFEMNSDKWKKVIGWVLLCLVGIASVTGIFLPIQPPMGDVVDPMSEAGGFNPCYWHWDDQKYVCESGGEIEIQSGATLDIQSGATTGWDAAMDLDSTLNVDGATTLGGAVTVNDNVSITGTLAVDGVSNLDDVDIDLSAEFEVDGHLTDFGGCTADVADGDNDVCIAAVLEVDGELEADGAIDADSTSDFADTATFSKGSGDAIVVSAGGTLNVNGVLDAVVNTEHLGVPSVIKTDITYTAAAGGTGAVTTIADGEIWFVWAVFVNVTTDFDCTGDDATLVVGDGLDPNGFVDLADAELQAADTEQTGSPAGWQGLVAATMGVYLDGAVSSAPHIYAPSGSPETIDWLVDEGDGETITAGEATIYVIYTRIQ